MLIAGQSTHSYKQYQRQQRKVVSEGVFTGGMHFSDNPLGRGTSRLIVNMIQKDNGERVRPRGGWRTLTSPISLGTDLEDLYIHHTGTTFIKDKNSDDTFLRRYALLLSHSIDKKYGSLADSKLLIEESLDITDPNFNIEPGKLLVCSLAPDAEIRKIKHNARESTTRIHGMPIDNPFPKGMHASIEGNTYLLTPEGLGRLDVYYDNGVYTHEVNLVTPLEVTPMQAVNYGYNMLQEDPYNFVNKVGPTFKPQGILPYDVSTGFIKMQAKIGEPVKFKLIYEYVTDAKYKVQWEVQDIYKRDGVNVIVSKENSHEYTNGEEISLEYTSPLKQFSVIATIYDAEDLTNPLRTILLASYHLSDDSNPTRMEQRNFDLMSATDVTVWKNQMVYCGVQGAEMTIFISDINDPTYVPFPHHAITFNEKVIKAFPHMDGLMVITENTMFQVEFAQEEGFTFKPVQTNVQLRDDDADAMYSIRNMVCFKSRNYYYMVVPNVKNDRGELQIAPVSNGVTQLLDSFQASVRRILSEVYTLRYLFNAPDEDILITLDDYSSYPDGNRLRYVYKLKLSIYDEVHYVDFHLIYDTVFRTWTIEVLETTKNPLHVFQSLSTSYAHFLGVYKQDDETFVQWIGVDENNPMDNFNLDDGRDRVVGNFQMFDTGKRDLQGTMKKRFRHVILEINNLEKEDVEFNHIVYIDDEPRTDLFQHRVVHETNPSSPNYGQIYVEREYVDTTKVYGTSKLDTWSLGNSQFPEQTVLKVHLDITGKGFYPRLKIITRTNRLYELNNVSWSYRDMNAR